MATRIRQFDRIRYVMQVFVTGYLGFTSALIVHTRWGKVLKVMKTTSNIDVVFQQHEEALDAAMKGFFLTDSKAVELIMAIANTIIQFTEELWKWRITTAGARMDIVTKLRHGKPMITFFLVFEKKMELLVRHLITTANREMNTFYADFVKWIDLNHVYH